jgi:hypothetical protein
MTASTRIKQLVGEAEVQGPELPRAVAGTTPRRLRHGRQPE